MRRIHRRRRAVAVGVLALPIAVIALATSWPSSKKAAAKPATANPPPTLTDSVAPAASNHVAEPKEVRGIHLEMYQATDGKLIQKILSAAAKGGINTVQLDIKNERGEVGFLDAPKLAIDTGAAQNYYEPLLLVKQLHDAGIYVIGRIVTFQDPTSAKKRPKLAIHSTAGGLWKNTHQWEWFNPYDERAWEYPIALGKAAGAFGFDEIQFDYVRFPTDGDSSLLKYPVKKSGPMSDTIAAFLSKAAKELHAMKVKISADLFGLAAQADQGIGQDPRKLRDVLDAISPMAYPSHYGNGEYNLAHPAAQPYELMMATLEEWQRALAGGTAELRPWLQAFTLGSISYGTPEIMAQVKAVRQSQPVGGFLLWNPSSSYSNDVLAISAHK